MAFNSLNSTVSILPRVDSIYARQGGSTGDVNSSDFRSRAWREQSQAWEITADLWCSPIHIRLKGSKYLDKFKNEPEGKYEARLNASVFLNKFRDTIEGMSGTVFRSDPKPAEAPPAIAELFTDIDGCGNSLHQVLLTSFEYYLRDGNGFFYIDAPPPPDVPEGEPQPTQADRANDRPWITFFTASQLINHRYETIGGKSVLTLATIEKCTLQPDGLYGEREVKQHLVLTPGAFEIQEEVEKDGKKLWITVEGPTATGLDDIPLIPIAEIGNEPPLLVLAMLNLLYYNKSSDFDDWCHLVCVPERVYKFDDKTAAEEFTKSLKDVSPGRARILWGEHSEATFNEPTGTGVEVAHTRIQEVETQMGALGMGMFSPVEGEDAKSATEIVDTAGRRQSKLARYTREFENAVEKALFTLAEMLNAIRPGAVQLSDSEGTSLQLKLDYSRLTFSLDQLKFFAQAVKDGQLSKMTFFELLQNLLDLPDGWTPDEEQKRLKDEEPIVPDVVPPPMPPIGAIQ